LDQSVTLREESVPIDARQSACSLPLAQQSPDPKNGRLIAKWRGANNHASGFETAALKIDMRSRRRAGDELNSIEIRASRWNGRPRRLRACNRDLANFQTPPWIPTYLALYE